MIHKKEESMYWLGFSACSGIGPSRFKKLIAYFGGAEFAWHANLEDLRQSGIGDAIAERIVAFRKKFDPEKYAVLLDKKKIEYLLLTDAAYPKLLSQIKNPPFVLYFRGDFEWEKLGEYKSFGVVGTRKITAYGTQVTELIVSELVDNGCVIVSGLAMGVDSCAHRTTIENGGKTIAVLGSGVDYCTPRENESLYQRIIESGGAIVSEMPLGQEPVKGSFPSRNRIIAGLSDAIIVTEGAEDSGALITAKDAFSNNRKVFAVPGPITSNYSKGPNRLIAQGAVLLHDSKSILQTVAVESKSKKKTVKLDSPDERKIYDFLNEPKHIDELIKAVKIPAAKVGSMLSIMEMKGLVRNCGGGVFVSQFN